MYSITKFLPTRLSLGSKPGKKLIFVSISIPNHIENIIQVLDYLSSKEYEIHIFPEWFDNVSYNNSLVSILNNYYTIHFDCSRILPLLSASIFLSTVAGKNYYFPRKAIRIFYFHSTAGMDGFPPNALKSFDYIFTATNQQHLQLSHLYKGSNKILIKAGYPKLDKLRLLTRSIKNCKKNKFKNIIFAPSFVDDGIYEDVSIFYSSLEIISFLINKNFFVIFRPHPLSYKRKKNNLYIKSLIQKFDKNSFSLDIETSYFDSFCCSDLMITDVSATSLNYRLAFQKPVIYFTPNIQKAIEAFSLIPELGTTCDDIRKLPDLIEKLCSENLSLEIPNAVFNLDKSVEKYVELIDSIAQDAK